MFSCVSLTSRIRDPSPASPNRLQCWQFPHPSKGRLPVTLPRFVLCFARSAGRSRVLGLLVCSLHSLRFFQTGERNVYSCLLQTLLQMTRAINYHHFEDTVGDHPLQEVVQGMSTQPIPIPSALAHPNTAQPLPQAWEFEVNQLLLWAGNFSPQNCCTGRIGSRSSQCTVAGATYLLEPHAHS